MKNVKHDPKVGSRIKKIRTKMYKTRQQLADKLGVSVKHIYEIETGKTNFSADLLKRICTELSVSCDYIMFGKKESSPFDCRLNAHEVESVEETINILNGLICDKDEDLSEK